MGGIFEKIMALCIIAPVIVYILMFIIIKKWTKNHRQATKQAMDVTTFFIILSVHFLIFTILGHSYFWAILVTLIGIAVLVVLVHY